MSISYTVTDATLDTVTSPLNRGNLSEYGLITLADGTTGMLTTSSQNSSEGHMSILFMNEDGTWDDTLTDLVSVSARSEQPAGIQATALADGGFYVAWYAYDTATRDYTIYGQAFDADGTARGTAAELISIDSNDGIYVPADVTQLADGTVAVIWEFSSYPGGNTKYEEEYGIYGQILETDGTLVKDTFEVEAFNDDTGAEFVGYYDSIGYPTLMALPDGGFVVTFQENDTGSNASGNSLDDNINIQFFDENGDKVNNDFEIMDAQEVPGNNQDMHTPVSAAGLDGGVLSVAAAGNFTYYARFLAADGTLSGYTLLWDYTDFDTRNQESHGDVTVAALADGRYLAAWTVWEVNEDDETTGSNIMGQFFNANGTAVGDATVLVSGAYTYGETDYWYLRPEITPTDDGGFILNLEALISEVDPVFVFTAVDDTIITGTSGADTLEGDGDAETYTALAGHDLIGAKGGDDTIDGGAGNDTLNGNAGNDLIDGGNGNDLIRGGGLADTITGGDGDDTVYGGSGQDYVDLGDGDDMFFDDGQGNANGRDTILGGAGDDWIIADGGNDVVNGGGGDDLILGGSGKDDLRGGNGNDVILGGFGADTVQGGKGDDLIDLGTGNDLWIDSTDDGNDTVNGGDGKDVLEAAGGDDVLTGGDGTDLFVFKAGFGHDTITDFDVNADEVDATEGFGVTEFDDLTLEDTASGVLVYVAGDLDNTILFADLEAADLQPWMFYD